MLGVVLLVPRHWCVVGLGLGLTIRDDLVVASPQQSLRQLYRFVKVRKKKVS